MPCGTPVKWPSIALWWVPWSLVAVSRSGLDSLRLAEFSYKQTWQDRCSHIEQISTLSVSYAPAFLSVPDRPVSFSHLQQYLRTLCRISLVNRFDLAFFVTVAGSTLSFMSSSPLCDFLGHAFSRSDAVLARLRKGSDGGGEHTILDTLAWLTCYRYQESDCPYLTFHWTSASYKLSANGV